MNELSSVRDTDDSFVTYRFFPPTMARNLQNFMYNQVILDKGEYL